MIEVKNEKGIRYLYIDGTLWMSDEETEQELQKELAEKSHGDVLVAGLGFGLYQKYCYQNPQVTSVTTVEKSKDVIDWMNENEPKIMAKMKVINEDFFNFKTDKKYDTICGDIWLIDDEVGKKIWRKYKEKCAIINNNATVLGWLQDRLEK